MPIPSVLIQSATEAAQRWAAAMRSRSQRRPYKPPQMAPWDENVYFQTPRETVVAPTLFPSIAQVVVADPMRVGIIFAANGPTPVFITTNGNPNSGQGFTQTTNISPILLTQSQFGPLVAMAWFCYVTAAMATNLTVWEISMTRWPG